MVSTGLLQHWTAGRRLKRFPANRLRIRKKRPLFQVIRQLRERGCSLARVWLGGNSLAEADQWVWPDGQRVSEDSAMWGLGEPAPGGGECMMLVEREWEAADCLDDTSVKAFLAHHSTAELPESTKPPMRPTPKPTQPPSNKPPKITTDPGLPQTPSR